MTAPPRRNPWIAHARPNPRARLCLFCFPYAGGSAAIYRRWGENLPAEVEVMPVEIPGRASRFREAPFRRLLRLVEEAGEALRPELDRPYAFFGHSMGGLISFELARRLRDLGVAGPRWLFVSARRSPDCPLDDELIHALPEAEFVQKLRELNGTPEEVLQHPELMAMMLPLLRADFEVNETYEFQQAPPLTCPISALGGLGDEEVTREHLQGWRRHTTGGFSLRMLPGDHFFLDGHRDLVLQAVAKDLAGVIPAT
jgi:surfactin synthase thioesterase subunit